MDNRTVSTFSTALISTAGEPEAVTYMSGIGNGSSNLSDFKNYSGFYPKEFQYPPLDISGLVRIPLYILIFILAVLGNTLVIVTLIQNKRMRTVTNVFLLNLSISDLLLAVFCMPFTIIPMLLQNFIFGPTICVMIRYLQAVSVSVSCFTLVAISLERYFAICRPLESRKWQTLSHSYKTIAVCWFLAFLFSVPIAIFTKFRWLPHGNAQCREIWDSLALHKAYTLFLDIILLVLPVIVMSLSYGKIAHTLSRGLKMEKQEMEIIDGLNGTNNTGSFGRGSLRDGFGRTIAPSEDTEMGRASKTSKRRFDYHRGIRQSNSEKSRAAKKRVIRMLFVIVLEFFLFWTPVFVIQTWKTFDENNAVKNVSPVLLSIFFLLSYVSSCCNPITYCFMNKKFRQGFISVFRCCWYVKAAKGRSDLPSYACHYSSSRTAISQISAYEKVNESDEM
ncbi:hypothetical protein CHS0354_018668 [Potamilus streckersoni]|uniref:Gastrin/cholecystokinin type B receptor n=1 Tax=Potamilus streckersoni TaxID=2493646 RepID=A0AAE0SKJ7_9BIVA|nr:hypothetical protein CHS0354_018668 [Potamilus streckersoni]